MDKEAPEAPRLFSLRLGVYPPSQVLQTDGRLYHLAPASRVVGGITGSRVPWLHGSYPASPLLRTPPPPSASSADFPAVAGYTTYLAPPISRRDEEGFSSCVTRPCHRAVTIHPAGVTDSSQPDYSAVMLPSPYRCNGLGLRGSVTFGATSCVRFRYGPVTRRHPEDDVVDGLQRFSFLPPCHPSYKVSGFYLGGTDSR